MLMDNFNGKIKMLIGEEAELDLPHEQSIGELKALHQNQLVEMQEFLIGPDGRPNTKKETLEHKL